MRCLVFATLTAVLVMVADAGATPPANSGIEGVISVSPSRPGPARIGVVDKAPAPNLTFVVKQGDSAISSFTTDAEGHFRVSLPPGHYIVLREDAGAAVGRWRFEADVAANQITKVNWTGDSGMR